jgi:hypothetical protein
MAAAVISVLIRMHRELFRIFPYFFVEVARAIAANWRRHTLRHKRVGAVTLCLWRSFLKENGNCRVIVRTDDFIGRHSGHRVRPFEDADDAVSKCRPCPSRLSTKDPDVCLFQHSVVRAQKDHEHGGLADLGNREKRVCHNEYIIAILALAAIISLRKSRKRSANLSTSA